jgi:antitoxin PrlF
MKKLTSTITSKGQITVPKKVRESLDIREGDMLIFELADDRAVIRKIPVVDLEWTKALQPTLNEWEDNIDDEL